LRNAELDGWVHRRFCGSFRSSGSVPSACPSVLYTEADVCIQCVCQTSRRHISECRNLSIERLRNFRYHVQFLIPWSWFGFLYRVRVKCCHVSEGYTACFFRVTVQVGAELTRKICRLCRAITLKVEALCFAETSVHFTIARCTNPNEYRHLINSRRDNLATCVICRM